MLRSNLRLAALMSATVLGAAAADSGTASKRYTFHQDVEPILQNRCQGCHRPGEAAPMSFLSYDEVRPWAKAIRSAVLLGKMPPWFADSGPGEFRNDHRLSQQEIDTLVEWVDEGAREGDAADAPQPREFVDGWRIGRPDVVFKMSKAFQVPAKGDIDYRYHWVKTGFTQDKWVYMAEVRPGNRRAVHHINVSALVPKDPDKVPLGEFYTFDSVSARRASAKRDQMFNADMDSEWVGTYAPGTTPNLAVPGQARLIKAGAYLLFQLHYTATGQPETDQSEIGFIFADQPPSQRIKTIAVQNYDFSIPPGADNHPIKARALVRHPFSIAGHLPHMHLRGKAFETRAIYPDGRVESLIRLPKYDFNWQLTYYPTTPQYIPAGTILEVVGHYDNSANNPANPDPAAEVVYGEQTWNEMLGGVMDILIEPELESTTLLAVPPDSPGQQRGGDAEAPLRARLQ